MNVAIIPARGGSRRIPRKNIRPFHGKPIIAYSIEAAKASGLFEHVVVSTDDDAIANVAVNCGAGIHHRPAEFSEDQVGTQEVMRLALQAVQRARDVEFEYACCIYATAPLMTADDLREAWCDLERTWSCYSCIEGWLYWGTSIAFLRGVPLLASSTWWHPESRWIDINTEEDWMKAEKMYADLHRAAA